MLGLLGGQLAVEGGRRRWGAVDVCAEEAFGAPFERDGEAEQCGWLRDRFGVSWQVVPECLAAMLNDADRSRAGRVMQAVLGMVKLDVAGLEKAYADPSPG